MSLFSFRVERARAVIAKYIGRYGLVSGDEAKELAEAYQDIAEHQKNCRHIFENVTTFTSHEQRCSYCDIKKDESPL
jgi:hypothetical protein